MIQLNLRTEEKQELNYLRYNHEHQRVRQKMEALWLKSQSLSHQDICKLTAISSTTLTRYLKQYQSGGIEALQMVNFRRPESQLEVHRTMLREHFERHPPETVKKAIADIHELTGIELKREAVRVFLHRLGLSVRKVGMVPAKVDGQTQQEFKKNT